MITETMTIHRALSELKVLENRILKSTCDAKFCAVARDNASKINGVNITDFVVAAQSSFDKVVGDDARYNAIKKEISLSNAKTMVTINGVEYTVAEAIYLNQHGIDRLSGLLGLMRNQYAAASRDVESANAQLSDKADRYIASIYNSKDGVNADDIKKARETYIEANTMRIVNGEDTKKRIDALAEKIDKFKAEVDAALSVSNATTEITISY